MNDVTTNEQLNDDDAELEALIAEEEAAHLEAQEQAQEPTATPTVTATPKKRKRTYFVRSDEVLYKTDRKRLVAYLMAVAKDNNPDISEYFDVQTDAADYDFTDITIPEALGIVERMVTGAE